MNIELEFDIENSEIRPEFEVLKTYFSKSLSMNNLTVHICAEFETGRLISQLATSEDVEKINREIIEGVRFKFINKNFLSKTVVDGFGNLLDISQLQTNGEKKNNLYDSGEDLLDDVLKNQKQTRPDKIKQINQYLSILRNKGRQIFLENPPENFSRIVHDYSDESKGFIIWKDSLEERLS